MDSVDKHNKKSKLAWLGSRVVVVALGTAGVVTAWFELSLKSPSDLVIVKAVDRPIKVKPDVAGGMNISHQNLLVIDLLKDSLGKTDNVETLRPSQATPEPPPVSEGKSDIATTDLMLDEALSKTLTSNTGHPAGINAKTSTTITSPTAGDLRTESTVMAHKKTRNEAVAKTSVKTASGPLFLIQLAAFRSDDKAEEMASLLSEKHSSRLQGMRLETMRLDTGTNGIFFRVVSTPMQRANAESACSKLRRAGQDCFLRKFVAPEG